MNTTPEYSIIVPVYNRPDEVDELLHSLTRQSERRFEVVVVEDGSAVTCRNVCERYAKRLDLHYFEKPNSGPGQSRNYGAERARGRWLIILDSDVVLPDGYLMAVTRGLKATPCDAFGGPDSAHPSFTPVQKAISYSMTSFFTTGGIRGGKKKMDKFYPRSFNMGIRADVYRELGGFSHMRFGEDIDFSTRIFESGHTARLLPETWVWHKRRTDFAKFWRQVFNSGIARIHLTKRHPGTLKAVHLLPAVFTVGCALLAVLFFVGFFWSMTATFAGTDSDTPLLLMYLAEVPFALYALLIFIDSTMQNKSAGVGLLSICAAFVQLWGYGCGFLQAWWQRCVRGKGEFAAYEENFYS